MLTFSGTVETQSCTTALKIQIPFLCTLIAVRMLTHVMTDAIPFFKVILS